MDPEPDRDAETDGCFPTSPMAAANGLSEDDRDAVLAEQRQDWITGQRMPVAERLQQDAALAADAARAAELVYHEFLLREELGESPDWEDYPRQFPQLAPMLRLLHQADQLVEQTLTPAEPAAQPTPHVNDYELLGEIGRGGMAVVYRARQLSLQRVVALKMILTGQFASAAEVKRFHTEAEAVARLQHPNIVQIHAIGEHDGQPFLTLEYVDGGTLSAQLAGQPLPPRQAAQLTATLAHAVHHAHERGIVHLDLKPANILLAVVSCQLSVVREEPQASSSLTTDNWQLTSIPKITDFGLARKWEEGVPATMHSGIIRGTPSYMAPEQANADKKRAVGPRSDVYALGAILYELLTGRPPFLAATPLETLEQVRNQEPVPPRQLQPKVARDLETICLKCLEKEPARRYPSAADLAADLERWLRGEPVRARRVGPLGRVGRWCRRQPAIASLAAVLLLVVAGGFAAILMLWRQSAHNETQALANLHNEAAARQEAEDNFKVLLQTLNENIQVSGTPFLQVGDANPALKGGWLIRPGGVTHFFQASDINPVAVELLLKAETCCTRLLQKHGQDQELRALLSQVLTGLGNRYLHDDRPSESLACLEKSVRLFEQLPPPGARRTEFLHAAVLAHSCLGAAYERLGRRGAAHQSFETSLRLWHQLAQAPRDPAWRSTAFFDGLFLAQVLRGAGHAEEEIQRRFERLRDRPELLGGAPQYDRFLHLLRVQLVCLRARQSPHVELAAVRAASAIVDRYHQDRALDQGVRCWVALSAIELSFRLRKGEAAAEALRLAEQAKGMFRELVREAPQEPDLFRMLSESWYQIGKVHWDLDQVEETLDACRHAVEAQRQAAKLAPSMSKYRYDFGWRQVQLGRKYCELGRLDEAEACFREWQALWPGDAVTRAEAVTELRKWAAEAGAESAPEKRLECQRYLDLCARLESKGVGTAPTTAGASP